MTDSPADFSIVRHIAPGEIDVVRLEARDGLKVLVRIDVSHADWSRAQFGEPVIAAISVPGET